MSTLKVPDLVPPPEQDAKRLKEAFDGLSKFSFSFLGCFCFQ